MVSQDRVIVCPNSHQQCQIHHNWTARACPLSAGRDLHEVVLSVSIRRSTACRTGPRQAVDATFSQNPADQLLVHDETLVDAQRGSELPDSVRRARLGVDLDHGVGEQLSSDGCAGGEQVNRLTNRGLLNRSKRPLAWNWCAPSFSPVSGGWRSLSVSGGDSPSFDGFVNEVMTESHSARG